MRLADILSAKGNDVFSISPECTLADAVEKLVEFNCGSLIVCKHEQMVGIITERDILRACARREGSLDEMKVSANMTTDLITGSPDDSVEKAMGLMTLRRVRHLPVLDDGRLAGLVSIGDVVKAQHDRLTLENHYLKSYIQS